MKARVLEVAELSQYIKNVFDSDPVFSSVKLRGEVSNMKVHSSGNVYLSMKDEKSKIDCIISRRYIKGKPGFKDGDMVIAKGYISIYEARGIYQFVIEEIELEGIGELYRRYLQLKDRLEKEGLFDISHKIPIPGFPKRIGVITSPTGAVIRDIINVVQRRYPKVEIVLYPALVQGKGSALSLVEAMEFFNSHMSVDTIIIGRGGGSIEELWSFNEEILARAIYDSKIPVISAVGHETDFTICDFVSDMRAPTPSAAAEIATPNLNELVKTQEMVIRKITDLVNRKIELERYKLDSTAERSVMYVRKFLIRDRQLELDRYIEMLSVTVENRLDACRNELRLTEKSFEGLNPFAVLNRGYSITEKDGRVIVDSSDVSEGDLLDITLKKGRIKCKAVR